MNDSESTAKRSISGKINLYMIGHQPDAHYLDRLLGQVKTIIKRISFVVTDDSPFDFWEAMFDKHGIPFYISRCEFESREQFDFSEARNKALNRCTSRPEDWFLWLDCDDTIEHPERILDALPMPADVDALAMPYNVHDSQSNLHKIRIHRHGEWKWINRVHEELVPIEGGGKKKRVKMLRNCIVDHSPDSDKSNHDFHIELLKDGCKNAPNEYAYIAKEHFNSCRYDEAIEWFEKTLAIHPLTYERFHAQLYIGIAHAQMQRPDEAMEAMRKAILIKSYRREPYYYLAEVMGKLGTDWFQPGLANIANCNAQIDQGEPGQDSRIYNCLGYKLHARYLQKFGRWSDAHAIITQAKTYDDEAKQIVLECEAKLQERAIQIRDA